MSKTPVYFSFDVESRGPDLLKHGINAIGIVAFDEHGNELEAYETGIAADAGQVFDSEVKELFWDKNPEVLKWIDANSKPGKAVVQEIVDLFDKYAEKHSVVWIAYPAPYDWALLIAFCQNVGGIDVRHFGHKATCISTLMKAYRAIGQLTPDAGFSAVGLVNENPHRPASDARVQGQLYFKLTTKFIKTGELVEILSNWFD